MHERATHHPRRDLRRKVFSARQLFWRRVRHVQRAVRRAWATLRGASALNQRVRALERRLDEREEVLLSPDSSLRDHAECLMREAVSVLRLVRSAASAEAATNTKANSAAKNNVATTTAATASPIGTVGAGAGTPSTAPLPGPEAATTPATSATYQPPVPAGASAPRLEPTELRRPAHSAPSSNGSGTMDTSPAASRPLSAPKGGAGETAEKQQTALGRATRKPASGPPPARPFNAAMLQAGAKGLKRAKNSGGVPAPVVDDPARKRARLLASADDQPSSSSSAATAAANGPSSGPSQRAALSSLSSPPLPSASSSSSSSASTQAPALTASSLVSVRLRSTGQKQNGDAGSLEEGAKTKNGATTASGQSEKGATAAANTAPSPTGTPKRRKATFTLVTSADIRKVKLNKTKPGSDDGEDPDDREEMEEEDAGPRTRRRSSRLKKNDAASGDCALATAQTTKDLMRKAIQTKFARANPPESPASTSAGWSESDLETPMPRRLTRSAVKRMSSSARRQALRAR